MSEKDRAILLMVQSTFILYSDKGKAQITPEEWLTLCDELLETSQLLGQIGIDLVRRREKIEEFTNPPARIGSAIRKERR